MQRLWSGEELGEHWTLRADDLALLAALPAGSGLRHNSPIGGRTGVFPTTRPISRRQSSAIWPPRLVSMPMCSKAMNGPAEPGVGIGGWLDCKSAPKWDPDRVKLKFLK